MVAVVVVGHVFGFEFGGLDDAVGLLVAFDFDPGADLEGAVALVELGGGGDAHGASADDPVADEVSGHGFHLAAILDVLALSRLPGLSIVVATARIARLVAAFHLNLVSQDGIVALEITLHLHIGSHSRHSVFHLDVGGHCDLYGPSTDHPRAHVTVGRHGLNGSVELGVHAREATAPRPFVVPFNLNLDGQDGPVGLNHALYLDRSPYLGHAFMLIHPRVGGHFHVGATDDPGAHASSGQRVNHAVELDEGAWRGRIGRSGCSRVRGHFRHPIGMNLYCEQGTIGLNRVVDFHTGPNSQIAHHDGVGVARELNACDGKTGAVLGVQRALQFRVWLHLFYFHPLSKNATIPVGHSLHLDPRSNRRSPHASTNPRQRVHLHRDASNLPLTNERASGHTFNRTFQFHRIRICRCGHGRKGQKTPHKGHKGYNNDVLPHLALHRLSPPQRFVWFLVLSWRVRVAMDVLLASTDFIMHEVGLRRVNGWLMLPYGFLKGALSPPLLHAVNFVSPLWFVRWGTRDIHFSSFCQENVHRSLRTCQRTRRARGYAARGSLLAFSSLRVQGKVGASFLPMGGMSL